MRNLRSNLITAKCPRENYGCPRLTGWTPAGKHQVKKLNSIREERLGKVRYEAVKTTNGGASVTTGRRRHISAETTSANIFSLGPLQTETKSSGYWICLLQNILFTTSKLYFSYILELKFVRYGAGTNYWGVLDEDFSQDIGWKQNPTELQQDHKIIPVLSWQGLSSFGMIIHCFTAQCSLLPETATTKLWPLRLRLGCCETHERIASWAGDPLLLP